MKHCSLSFLILSHPSLSIAPHVCESLSPLRLVSCSEASEPSVHLMCESDFKRVSSSSDVHAEAGPSDLEIMAPTPIIASVQALRLAPIIQFLPDPTRRQVYHTASECHWFKIFKGFYLFIFFTFFLLFAGVKVDLISCSLLKGNRLLDVEIAKEFN